jgi:hypothetical protein
MSNHLYEFTMKVFRGHGCDLPEGLAGAYVPSYVGAPDYQSALRKGVAEIKGMHYNFDGIEGQVRELPLPSWDEYISKAWPEFADRFPSASELPSLVEKGVVFFGPFAGFEGPV